MKIYPGHLLSGYLKPAILKSAFIMLLAPMVHSCQKSKPDPRQESGLQWNTPSTPLPTNAFSHLRFGGYSCKSGRNKDLIILGQLDGTYNFYRGTSSEQEFEKQKNNLFSIDSYFGKNVEVLTGLNTKLTDQTRYSKQFTWSKGSQKMWLETITGDNINNLRIYSLDSDTMYKCRVSLKYAKSPPNIDDTLKIMSHKNNELSVIEVKVDALVNDQGKHLILSLTNLKKDRSPLKEEDNTINSPVLNANNEIVGYVKSYKVRGVLGVSILSIHDPAFAQHLVEKGHGRYGFKQIDAKMPSVSTRFISDFCVRFKQLNN